ncbi:uncharacterized protein FIESC28_00244 [Fusarium coffeatum]|uniref:Uncharacterized protein n=1 Tax=Fusarium coffeatum TaxID=231269 RepID=A0A366SE91_9HYPO|nr:uncharacterized protein FIESC28_00244 [Fusarium coffeatum]RBR26976.1 hypothetical protein FIESC28_00244 [Fusarium coffeatum]
MRRGIGLIARDVTGSLEALANPSPQASDTLRACSTFVNSIGVASDSAIATTATTSGSSGFTSSLDSSATVATTTTEAVTPADSTTEATTVTQVDTATADTTTSDDVLSETTTLVTSVATTEEASATVADATAETTTTSDAVTTSAEITEAPTTTEATTIAAPTTTTVPMFRLGAKLTFNSLSGYHEAFITVDSTTGHLLLDGQKPICGWTPGDGTSALVVCSDNMSAQEKFITCEAPTSRQLECTVPELFCSMFTGCTATGNLWGTTYIGASGGTGVDPLFLGPDYSQGNTAVPLLIVHSSD